MNPGRFAGIGRATAAPESRYTSSLFIPGARTSFG